MLINIGSRFDDRVTGKTSTLRAERQGHPRRHRPGRDRQERPRRRADRRRRAARAAGAAGGAAAARHDPSGLRISSASARGSMPATQQYTRPDTEIFMPHDVYVGLQPHRQRARRLSHLHRRRPAPDVGGPAHRVAPATLAYHQRRPRHDGLRAAGGDRRAGRPPRRDGLGDRRRRRLPDDASRSWRRSSRSSCRSRSRSSTTATSAWCASGRSCSTTGATRRRRSLAPTSSSWPRPTASRHRACDTRRRSTPAIERGARHRRAGAARLPVEREVERLSRWCRRARISDDQPTMSRDDEGSRASSA